MEAIPIQVRRAPLLALLIMLVFTSSGQDAQAALRGPSSPGQRTLYTALDGDQTDFWVAPASTPERAGKIASVIHREGYGVRARPSPDGRLVAYSLWPPGDAGTPAELWVLSFASAKATRLLTGNDLHSPPLWSPDSGMVVARRGTELLLVDVTSGKAATLLDAGAVLGVYPFAWSPAGDRIYYATIGNGTDVHYLDVSSGSGHRLFRASQGIARDFALGPGDVIAFSEVTPAGLDARWVDLSGTPAAPPVRLSAASPPLPAHIPGYLEFSGWLP